MKNNFEYNRLHGLPVKNGSYSTITDKRLLKQMPSLMDGCYSATDDVTILSWPSKVKIHAQSYVEEEEDTSVDSIENNVNQMFNEFAQPSDLRCECFANGISNLLYGVSVPKIKNAEIKGDEQEAEVAMFYRETNPIHQTNQMYLGPSIRSRK